MTIRQEQRDISAAAETILSAIKAEGREPTRGEWDCAMALHKRQTDLDDMAREGRGDTMNHENRNTQGRKVPPEICGPDGIPETATRASGGEVWIDTATGKPARVLRHAEKIHRPKSGELRFGAYVRALLVGKKTEQEVRALSVGTDSAGGFTVPDPLSTQISDLVRAQSVVSKLGARTVDMQSDTLSLARLESDPGVAHHVENASDLSVAEPTFSKLTLQSHTVGGIFQISRELVQDAPNAVDLIERAFAQSLALKLDLAALIGSGPITGISATSGIGEVAMATNGTALADYDQFIDLQLALANANAGEVGGFVMAPRTRAALAKLKDSTSQPLRRPEALEGATFAVTTQMPIDDVRGTATDASRVIAGKWSDCLIGMRSSIQIEILKERYADSYQYGMLAAMRVDVQLLRSASFAQIVGIIP